MVALFVEKSWSERLRIVFWLIIIAGVILVFYILVRGQDLVIRAPDSYQAVFLDNGQVYFGKLKSLNRDLWSLNDVYYLRAGAPQQAGNAQTPASIDLIKLGAEIHAPRDEMFINKSHVVYYEDIGGNSEVMKLIRDHENKALK
jgi:hypothetical protein